MIVRSDGGLGLELYGACVALPTTVVLNLEIVIDCDALGQAQVHHKENLAVDHVVTTRRDVDGLVGLVEPHPTVHKRLFLHLVAVIDIHVVALPSLLIAGDH